MKRFTRRSVLRLAALAGLASGLTWSRGSLGASALASTEVSVRRYVMLGRTGMQISDISFGSSRLRDGEEHLVDHALARGVNYFDTAASYTRGSAETVLGNALKGKRSRVFITTKMSAGAATSKEEMTAALEASLRRLQTDYVDIFMNHAVNEVDSLKNPQWLEFVAAAKKAGKIRFSGMSGHAGRLAECIEYAVDQDLVDVVLAAHNFGQDPAFYEQLTRGFDMVAVLPDLPRVLAKAKAKKLGVVAMKVLRGARLNDMRPFERGAATYAQAAFRWVLQNPFTDAVIISMTSREQIDDYLGASGGGPVTFEDRRLLEQYVDLAGMTYCQHACNQCDGSCPEGVPIADVLRSRMYATDYGDLEFAREEYQQLGAAAGPCLHCTGQPCREACPQGLQIASLCGPTHLMLS